MNLTTQKKAFTLIELLIVIVIIGILSTLLFRTLADMLTANARIQQEKIMTQELMTIQTTINNISEHYPIIDMKKYILDGGTTGYIGSNGFTGILYLKNTSGDTIQIYSTGSCDIGSGCYLAAQIDTKEIKITSPDRSDVSGIQFKILPTIYYTGSIYDNLNLNQINAQGFWIFGNLSYKKNKSDNKVKSSYNLQHFIHLQQ